MDECLSMSETDPVTETHPACTIPKVGTWLLEQWFRSHIHRHLTNTLTHFQSSSLGEQRGKAEETGGTVHVHTGLHTRDLHIYRLRMNVTHKNYS